MTNLCSNSNVIKCITNIDDTYIPCKASSLNCSNEENKEHKQKFIEAKIQKQVCVSQSQKNSVLTAFYIRENNKEFTITNKTSSSKIWGNSNYLRNQSDRIQVHYPKNNNIPTHGNSTKSSITSNKPGSMSAGGKGVDVKHGSYSRYLAKIKANNIINNKMGPFNHLNKEIVNNKLFRFSIVNTRNCCN